MKRRFFVTGATGCIGGWVVKNLVESGDEVFALARSGRLDKLSLIMPVEEIAEIHIIKGDLTDAPLVQTCMAENGIEKIIHLAAMQIPFCSADPRLGARVNVEGTINVFEAAKKCGIRFLVYSSSTAVYGTKDEYSSPCLEHDDPLIPHSHYGVYKQANEWSAKVYYRVDGISSIGIRPYVVYGPLRDQGMSSTPTTAMKSAVKLERYEISYGGVFNFQYADDTAKAFINAASVNYIGADAYNLGGTPVDMKDVVHAIELAEPRAAGLITYLDGTLPFPPRASKVELEKVIGQMYETPLVEGVRASMEIFRKNAAPGK
ncbi:MAG: NAD(P)-dependent oxidoreductase [Spirochaetes bacterium]|nr:NAD(P)-dependent oxidoreductase [Spirochaetota bacterium]